MGQQEGDNSPLRRQRLRTLLRRRRRAGALVEGVGRGRRGVDGGVESCRGFARLQARDDGRNLIAQSYPSLNG